jgi:dihydrofolate reductase
MRKIIIGIRQSFDGVVQAPSGSQEDTAGGFDLGGWAWAFSDAIANDAMDEYLYRGALYDLLLGRKTYEIFAGYWPFAPKDNPIAARFNAATKYVLSRGDDQLDWKISHKLPGIDAVKKLKTTDGPDLLIQGSSTLSSQLFSAGLIDRMHILTYPVVLGKGERLFAEGTLPGGMKLVGSVVSTTGIVVATYESTGQKPTLSSREPGNISDAEIKRRERVKRED